MKLRSPSKLSCVHRVAYASGKDNTSLASAGPAKSILMNSLMESLARSRLSLYRFDNSLKAANTTSMVDASHSGLHCSIDLLWKSSDLKESLKCSVMLSSNNFPSGLPFRLLQATQRHCNRRFPRCTQNEAKLGAVPT